MRFFDVRRLLRGLLQDPFVNRFRPRARTLDELCYRWAQRVRGGVDMGPAPPRSGPIVLWARQEYRPYTRSTVRSAAAATRFTVATLFGGAGGSSTGYQLAGGNVMIAVEFGPIAARNYQLNNRSCIVDRRNIRDILDTPDGIEGLLQSAGLVPGEIDILDGSPPCTEFSTAGKGIGDQSIPRVHSGVRQTNVATLPFAFAKFVHRARPRVAVMENVPGLVTVTPRLFERIMDALRYDGDERVYYVNWKILSSGNFGVAQNRRRVIVISIRKDVAERVGIKSDAEVLQAFPSPTHGMVSIRSALNGLKQATGDERPFLKSIRLSRLPRLLRQLPRRPEKIERLKNTKTNFTLARTSWDRPAPTLVIAGQKPDGLSGAIHPELDRKFTVPELKRLFGLPDDFILTGTIEDAVQCICNMVPPFLTKAVAERIYERVLKPLKPDI